MKSQVQRAREAQVAFAALILSGPNQISQDRVTETLRAVVATAELAAHDTRDMSPCQCQLLVDRSPALFDTLNKGVWAALMRSYPLGGVWPRVEEFVKENLNFSVLPVKEVYKAAKTLRAT